jgi:hypothetical protein
MLLLTVLLLTLAVEARAAAASEPAIAEGPRFVACLPDISLPPYLNEPGQPPGITERLLVDSAAKLGFQLSVVRMPSDRCRVMMRAGDADVFAAAPVPTNLAEWVFPRLPGGALDPAARLGRLVAVVIQRRDAPVMWDGAKFSAPKEAGVCRRRSILPINLRLLELGIASEIYANDGMQALRLVENKRCEMAVVWQEEFALKGVAEKFPNIIALPKPFLAAEYYLVASRDMPTDKLARFQQWSRLIGERRELPQYRPRAD